MSYSNRVRPRGQLKQIDILIRSVSIKHGVPIIKDDQFSWMNSIHPEIILSNLAIVHILSVIEGFFKNIYVALLTYSDKKENIISASKIKTSDLIDVGNSKLRLEQAYANNLNFQNVDRLCKNFDELDQALKIKQKLKKRRDGSSFYEFIEKITKHRNGYVHHDTKCLRYNFESLEKDLVLCEELIHCIYKLITQSKKWPYNDDNSPEALIEL